MDIKVIDNFLSQSEFEIILKNTIEREDLQLTFVSNINNLSTNSEDYWSWYLINMVYSKTASPKSFLMDAIDFQEVESSPLADEPQSEIYTNIRDIFVPRLKQVANFRSMIRIKINAYPYTNIVKEHKDHIDSEFHHTGAVFSLNTCDGFTKFSDGTKVESVANRIVFFDASKFHHSTTTSNAKLRYNINFNFI